LHRAAPASAADRRPKAILFDAWNMLLRGVRTADSNMSSRAILERVGLLRRAEGF
jgi:hypothetical protein